MNSHDHADLVRDLVRVSQQIGELKATERYYHGSPAAALLATEQRALFSQILKLLALEFDSSHRDQPELWGLASRECVRQHDESAHLQLGAPLVSGD